MENIKPDIHITQGYASPLPYPEIKVIGKNSCYAELIIDDYSGYVSELTAINQYIYHHFLIAKCNDKVANMVEKISIVEMKHLEMLAEILLLLGSEPLFRCPRKVSGAFRYWNGSFVGYGKCMCEQLELDLKSECNAIDAYRRHIELIKDPYIQEALARIILDEEVHVKLFKDAIEEYCIKQ